MLIRFPVFLLTNHNLDPYIMPNMHDPTCLDWPIFDRPGTAMAFIEAAGIKDLRVMGFTTATLLYDFMVTVDPRLASFVTLGRSPTGFQQVAFSKNIPVDEFFVDLKSLANAESDTAMN